MHRVDYEFNIEICPYSERYLAQFFGRHGQLSARAIGKTPMLAFTNAIKQLT